MVVVLSDSAIERLSKIIEEKKSEKPLRIYIANYGWGGPIFALALDELKEGDIEVSSNNLNFVIESQLEELYTTFNIDYSEEWMRRGFIITTDRKTGNC